MAQRILRVAAVLRAPADGVKNAVGELPTDVVSYVVETGAGVLVTLERRRSAWLPTRRRTLRDLQERLTGIAERVGRLHSGDVDVER